jgi:hypothetical protein
MDRETEVTLGAILNFSSIHLVTLIENDMLHFISRLLLKNILS